MFWHEEKTEAPFVVPDDVVDVAYSVACACLPVDHAWALSRALFDALPWLEEDAQAGMHGVHVPAAGHGWMRSENPEDLMYPSRRSHFLLRLRRERVPDALSLSGRTLDIGGYALTVQKATVRKLSSITTLLARYVASEARDEDAFLAETRLRLSELGVRPQKMLCGKTHSIATPDGKIGTRSLMLAELGVAESVRLQQHGLGPFRKLGCGLFIPYKSIREVSRDAE
jgi:CRISPR-associated protein Cas6